MGRVNCEDWSVMEDDDLGRGGLGLPHLANSSSMVDLDKIVIRLL